MKETAYSANNLLVYEAATQGNSQRTWIRIVDTRVVDLLKLQQIEYLSKSTRLAIAISIVGSRNLNYYTIAFRLLCILVNLVNIVAPAKAINFNTDNDNIYYIGESSDWERVGGPFWLIQEEILRFAVLQLFRSALAGETNVSVGIAEIRNQLVDILPRNLPFYITHKQVVKNISCLRMEFESMLNKISIRSKKDAEDIFHEYSERFPISSFVTWFMNWAQKLLRNFTAHSLQRINDPTCCRAPSGYLNVNSPDIAVSKKKKDKAPLALQREEGESDYHSIANADAHTKDFIGFRAKRSFGTSHSTSSDRLPKIARNYSRDDDEYKRSEESWIIEGDQLFSLKEGGVSSADLDVINLKNPKVIAVTVKKHLAPTMNHNIEPHSLMNALNIDEAGHGEMEKNDRYAASPAHNVDQKWDTNIGKFLCEANLLSNRGSFLQQMPKQFDHLTPSSSTNVAEIKKSISSKSVSSLSRESSKITGTTLIRIQSLEQEESPLVLEYGLHTDCARDDDTVEYYESASDSDSASQVNGCMICFAQSAWDIFTPGSQ